MGECLDIIKALVTRAMFAGHGFIAIWRVTDIKNEPYYWYLAVALLALFLETIFTFVVNRSQEWKWFCPSVFFYLCSVVPAIWLLELDKLDRRLAFRAGLNLTRGQEEELSAIATFGVELRIPVQLSAEHWATVLEQLLMLLLIIGRWLLPKGDLTRDQLSQLLLVYIGTAADIIEFFDTFKDDYVAHHRILCVVILAIWSWSLLQFTFVLTATKSRKPRLSGPLSPRSKVQYRDSSRNQSCCSIDVCGIVINMLLQDAPFLILRLLLIFNYHIISFMNIFFTCKNTLVLCLQCYRLFVIHVERMQHKKATAQKESQLSTRSRRPPHSTSAAPLIAEPARKPRPPRSHRKPTSSPNTHKQAQVRSLDIESPSLDSCEDDLSAEEDNMTLAELQHFRKKERRHHMTQESPRKGRRHDTGYSTASSSRGSRERPPLARQQFREFPVTPPTPKPRTSRHRTVATMTSRLDLGKRAARDHHMSDDVRRTRNWREDRSYNSEEET